MTPSVFELGYLGKFTSRDSAESQRCFQWGKIRRGIVWKGKPGEDGISVVLFFRRNLSQFSG